MGQGSAACGLPRISPTSSPAIAAASLWYRQIFRTRLAAHRNAVQEFITTTSLSCSAGSQKPPSSAANRNPLRPCTPPARWNGSPRRTKLAEPLRRSATAIAYGHREVVIRGYVHEVVISCGAAVIARHPRSYEREDFVFDPLHYLALLERKIGALDQAAPLVGWALPEEFATLRRLIEARMAKRGKREFVQVLRLLEVSRPEDVLAGVREAIARGAIGFDAVKHLVLCRIERRPPRLDLTAYPTGRGRGWL